MDDHEDFDSDPDDEVLRTGSGNIFGRRLTPPFSTESPSSNTSNNEAATSNSTLQSSASKSSAADDDIPSIFSQSSTAPASPAPSRPLNYSLPASRPLATASSSNHTRRARFLDENISVLGVATLPQAEKDGDDPTTPEGNDGTSQNRDYSIPAALTRLLASRAIPSGDSSTETYTLGNPNLVRPCKRSCR
jgi:hypothetical protein